MDMKRMRELAGLDSVRPGLSGTTEVSRVETHDPRDTMPASDYYKKLDTKSWVKDAEGKKVTCGKCATFGTNSKGPGAHSPGCPNDIKTPANKGPKKLKGKALDKEIEKTYYKLGHGVQIDIMDIDKVFKMGTAGYEKDGDLDAAVAAAIKHFRKN